MSDIAPKSDFIIVTYRFIVNYHLFNPNVWFKTPQDAFGTFP